MFDRDEGLNDVTHITPIQTFMFEKMIKDAGYRLLLHKTNNLKPRITNPWASIVCNMVSPFVLGFKGGEHHIFILTKV
jgi:hypothetical protein